METNSITIVIPVYNEAESLIPLNDALQRVMSEMTIPWEAIFVDDGSMDESLAVLEKMASNDPHHIRVISFRRNFGQTAAIVAGIDHSQGDVIIFMDADLQNDPADIPMMLEKINQGYDVVSGWRVNRQDTFFTRKLPSQIANWLISTVTGVRLHDYGCTLKAYRREVLADFHLYGEMHRFIPAYAASVGAMIVEVPVHHHARRFGRAKYGLGRTLKVILDLFTVKFLMSYANKPIYLFGGAGVVLIAISILTLIALVLRRIWYEEHLIRSPLLQLSTMLFIIGVQSILMGFVAELLIRTYHESQHKPIYTIRKVINEKKPE